VPFRFLVLQWPRAARLPLPTLTLPKTQANPLTPEGLDGYTRHYRGSSRTADGRKQTVAHTALGAYDRDRFSLEDNRGQIFQRRTAIPEFLYPGVYVEEVELGPRPIEGVPTSTAGFVGLTQKGPKISSLITSFADYVNLFGCHLPVDVSTLPYAVEGFFKNGGKGCYIARVDEKSDYTSALEQLEGIEDVSIVVAPDHHRDPDLAAEIVKHCERLQDRFAILHAPPGVHLVTKIEQFKPPVDTKFAAFYFPWINVTDPATEKDVLIPPSGHVAGIYARVDIGRGVFSGPANEVVLGANSLETNITDVQQQVLNPQGVNCIRQFPGRGIRVWGARTCSTDPEWKYVNVRRYLTYLEQSIQEGTEWAVFEPNEPQLWATVRNTISAFLIKEWHRGGLVGITPEEAFFVKVDQSIMTPDDILNGRLIILIGVAPLRPAEFVIFRIGQWTADAHICDP